MRARKSVVNQTKLLDISVKSSVGNSTTYPWSYFEVAMLTAWAIAPDALMWNGE
jgi:hypothetical protein